MIVGPAVLGLFAGAAASQQWQTIQLWMHGGTGRQDRPAVRHRPGLLPVHAARAAVRRVVPHGGRRCSPASAPLATQYLYGGLRVGGQRGGAPRTTRAARVQLSVIARRAHAAHRRELLAGPVLDPDEDGPTSSPAPRSPTCTPSSRRRRSWRASRSSSPCMFIVTAIRGNWRLPAIGVGLMVVAAIAVGGIYPAVVQRFQVQPNQQDAEAEFIQRNIDATLDAYGLEDVETTDYNAKVTAEAGRAARRTPRPPRRSGCSTRRSSARRSSSSSRSARSTTSPTRCRSTGTRSTARAATP